MLTAIGIRVESNLKVHYCILSSTTPPTNLLLIDISHVTIPKALEKPEQLNFIRNTVLDIFKEYSVHSAFIKISEYTGFGADKEAIERNYFEGVIQEAVASSSISKYRAAQIATISSLLSMPREDFKKYTKGKVYPNLPAGLVWTSLEENSREAFISAVSALHL